MLKRFPIQSIHLLVLLLLASLLFGACSQPAYIAEEAGSYAPQAPGEDAAQMAFEPESIVADSYSSGATVERIILKNANMSIVVDDPSITMDSVARMAEEMGGFVVSANLYQEELDSGAKVSRASITIRVPAENLNQALETIKSESDQDPISQSISSEDVTREYVNLQSRLRNLESAEEQLTKIMDSAIKTEEVLSVYNELVRVREQIEVIKGEIQYFEQAAALSAVSVELIANEALEPLTIGGWQPAGVAKNAIQALINTLKFFATLAIYILILVIPTLLVLYFVFILPLSLVWRAWRRRRAKKKEAEALPEAPEEAEEQGEQIQ